MVPVVFFPVCMKQFQAIILGTDAPGISLAGMLSARGLRTLLVVTPKASGSTKSETDWNALELRFLPFLEIIQGRAFFCGPRQLLVYRESAVITLVGAASVYINTGTLELISTLEGFSEIDYLRPQDLSELGFVPGHLVVEGGNLAALQWAQHFIRLGSRVTLLEAGLRLLPDEDPDLAEKILEVLEADGVTVLLEAKLEKGKKMFDGQLLLRFDHLGKKRVIECSDVLLTADGLPDTHDLNLLETGVRMDNQGFIRVNEHLQTACPGVFCLGNIHSRSTPQGRVPDEIRIFNDAVNGQASTPCYDFLRMESSPVFCRLGLTELQARCSGIDFRTLKMPLCNEDGPDGASPGPAGYLKLLISSEQLLIGAAVLAPEPRGLLVLLELALAGKIGFLQLQSFFFAAPGYSRQLALMLRDI